MKNAIRETAYDILRVVGLAPGKTATEVSEVVGIKSEYVREWLKCAERRGLTYYKWTKVGTVPTAIWYLNPVPFANTSDKRPPKRSREERLAIRREQARRHRQRLKLKAEA